MTNEPVTYKCPRLCGWSRVRQVDRAWMQREIDHPEYGKQPNWVIARLDILNHDCGSYHVALNKIRLLYPQWAEKFGRSGPGPAARTNSAQKAS